MRDMRKIGKQIKAAVLAMLMLLTSGTFVSEAAEPLEAFPQGGGTLTITKYRDNGAGLWDESDTMQTQPEGKETLDGATFTIKHVGHMEQKTYGADNAVELMFDISDENIIKMLSDAGIEAVEKTRYRSSDLDRALKLAYEQNPSVAEQIVSGETSATTANGGKAVFENLAQGLYLVAETGGPAEMLQKSVPFFVSMPSIVNDSNGNTAWTTDVHAYPKSAVGTIAIDKVIVEDGTQVRRTNVFSGEAVHYAISFSAPVSADGLRALSVMDRMSKGLSFQEESVKLYKMNHAGDTATEESKLLGSGEYTIESAMKDGGNTGETMVRFGLNEAYLDSLTRETTHFFRIEYDCIVNEQAVLGQAGNRNQADLQLTGKNEETTVVEGPQTTVYTYGISLKETGENAVRLKDVVFELEDGDGNPIPVTEKMHDGTRFYVAGGTDKTSGGGSLVGENASENREIKTDADGMVRIRGLEPGRYYLKEIKTNQGYMLLKDKIPVQIIQEELATGEVYAEVEGTAANMMSDEWNAGSETALVLLNVANQKGFDLPVTGGLGTAVFGLGGTAVFVTSAVLLLLMQKENRKKE